MQEQKLQERGAACVQNKGEPAGEGKDHTTEMGAGLGRWGPRSQSEKKKKSQTRERGWKLRGTGGGPAWDWGDGSAGAGSPGGRLAAQPLLRSTRAPQS